MVSESHLSSNSVPASAHLHLPICKMGQWYLTLRVTLWLKYMVHCLSHRYLVHVSFLHHLLSSRG